MSNYVTSAVRWSVTHYTETPTKPWSSSPVAKEASRDGDSHHFTAISLADLIQVGGVILGILSAFVFAATARARLVTTLIVCATVLLCGALYLLFVRRAGWRSLRISLQILLSVIMVSFAAAYANSPAQATGNA